MEGSGITNLLENKAIRLVSEREIKRIRWRHWFDIPFSEVLDSIPIGKALERVFVNHKDAVSYSKAMMNNLTNWKRKGQYENYYVLKRKNKVFIVNPTKVTP